MDEFDRDDVKKELNNRWRRLERKNIARSLVCIFGVIGQLIGMLGIVILFMLTMGISMLKLFDNFSKITPTDTDPFILFNGFKLFTLDDHYITWIVPISLFLISYACYRLTKSRNEPDILIESFRNTMITFGFIKKKKGN